jgi:hypothetical protein
MAEAGRWKPYEQRQGQLLPAFVDSARDRSDPVFFIDETVEQLRLAPLVQLRGRLKVLGEWNLVSAAANLRRLYALTLTMA